MTSGVGSAKLNHFYDEGVKLQIVGHGSQRPGVVQACPLVDLPSADDALTTTP